MRKDSCIDSLKGARPADTLVLNFWPLELEGKVSFVLSKGSAVLGSYPLVLGMKELGPRWGLGSDGQKREG